MDSLPQTPRIIPDDLNKLRVRGRWIPVVLCLAATGFLGCLGVCGAGIFFGVRSFLLAGPDAPGFVEGDPDIRQRTTEFNSAGSVIQVEHFEPLKPGKYPVVLVVHGLDGLQHKTWRKYYHAQGQELARNGYIALLVHYFDRTGTKTSDVETARKHFVTWAHTLLDAVSYAGQLPECNGGKVGMLGSSLGGTLVLSLGVFDKRIGAVVEVCGALPDPVSHKIDAKAVQQIPPTLMLHGMVDKFVPQHRVEKIKTLLEKQKAPIEVHFFQGQGHYFKGGEAVEAIERTITFFDKHLKK